MEQILEKKKTTIPFLTSIRSIGGLLRNYYKVNPEISKEIINDEDYFDVIKVILKNSELFDGINDEVILGYLKDQKIKINYLSPGNPIIKEGMQTCDSVYLLLCGELDIYKNGVKINTISGMGVVGEMAFLNPKLKRTATVKTPNGAYVLMLTRNFIDSLGKEYSEIIKQNLYNSITSKLIEANENTVLKGKAPEINTESLISSSVKQKVSSVYIGENTYL